MAKFVTSRARSKEKKQKEVLQNQQRDFLVEQQGAKGAPSGWYELTNKIPSGMRCYPKGARLIVRPYNYEEIHAPSELQEQFENQDKSSKVSNAPSHLVALYDKGVTGVRINLVDQTYLDGYNLTMGDYLYVLLFRKVAALGSTEFTIAGKDFVSKKLSIEDIEFSEIAEEVKFPITLTVTDNREKVKLGNEEIDNQNLGLPVKLGFFPPTVGRYTKWVLDNERVPSSTDVLSLSLIDPNQVSIMKSIIDFEEGGAIEQIDALMYHGIKDKEVKVINKKGQEVTRVVDFKDPLNLVIPFRKSNRPKKLKIEFG